MGQQLAESLAKFADVVFQPEEAERTRELWELVGEFLQVTDSKFTQLSQRLSELDKAVDQILHDIEVERFDMYQGYVTLTRLQVLRRERRKVKSLMEGWRVIKHSFGRTETEVKALRQAVEQVDSFYKYMGLTTEQGELAGGEGAAD